ncbi:MAG TPA: hypothetical protein VF812_02765, partial [Ktedonobacterales bacterium]
ASGTLSMARNVGTAFGVAIFGSVYLHTIDATLPVQLSALPPTRAAALLHAAEQFVVSAPGSGQRIVHIVQSAVDVGFIQDALVAALLCGLAAIAVPVSARQSRAPARRERKVARRDSRPMISRR